MTPEQLLNDSEMTHSDAQGFEDVHLAHGTGPVVQQPGVHAVLMEKVSDRRLRL